MEKYNVIITTYGNDHFTQVVDKKTGKVFPIVMVKDVARLYAEITKERIEALIKVVYLDGQNNPFQDLFKE